MMPNIVKGSDLGGLFRYLAGPGRANEHTNPKVIAGDLVTMAVYAGAIDVARATELAKLLDSPRQTVLRGAPVLATSYKKAHALIAEGMDRKAAYKASTNDHNAWHCALSLDPREGQLSEEKWSQIARRFMAEMGFTERGDDVPDVRWATVHHGLTKAGGDHIHIGMSVVRPDGSLVDAQRDWPRAQAAAGVIEREFGLRVLASREERSTERATTPHERAYAERVGAVETDRDALRRRVRKAAVCVENEAEFVADLKSMGISVAPRFATGGTEEVKGFKVRMPPQRNRETGAWETPIWFPGGKLAGDLTLTRIREWAGWVETDESREAALAQWRQSLTTRSGRAIRPSEMDQRAAIDLLAQWSATMRELPAGDREAYAHAASQTAGLFAAASVATETRPGPMHQLAQELARAAYLPKSARSSFGPPRPQVRSVAQMLLSAQKKSRQSDLTELVAALTECLLTVGDMLAATERAQTAVALTARAQRALTEIHMRAAGIDPNRAHTQAPGSPPWAAAARAETVVQRLDHDAAEAQIEDRIRTWQAHRVALGGHAGAGRVDEFGHVLKPGTGVKAVRLRSLDPPTPPANAARTTKRELDRVAAEAEAQEAQRAEGFKRALARVSATKRSGPFDPSRVRAADLSGTDYDADETDLGTPEGPGSSPNSPEQQQYNSPPPPRYGKGRDSGYER